MTETVVIKLVLVSCIIVFFLKDGETENYLTSLLHYLSYLLTEGPRGYVGVPILMYHQPILFHMKGIFNLRLWDSHTKV